MDIALNQRAGNLLEYLDLKKDNLLVGIEVGLSDFDACLDSLKVSCMKLNNVESIIKWYEINQLKLILF